MQLVVFEDAGYRNLLPLTWARATFELRCGCDTLFDKIARAVPGQLDAPRFAVRPEIRDVVGERICDGRRGGHTMLWVNGRLIARGPLELPCPSVCWHDDQTMAAAHLPPERAGDLLVNALYHPAQLRAALCDVRAVPFDDRWGALVHYPWDLIAQNAAELTRQIAAMPSRQEGRIDPGCHLLNTEAIRIGAGSRIRPTAVLDAEDGPIHIGQNVTISAGAVLRGPCSIGDGTLVQAAARIRGGTSIGPACKVGGEVEGSIFQGYSNKQHDGFVGHSYIGEWVNLGADTVTSDLKNTYGNIAVPLHGTPIDTGLRFVGSIIGDHSKTGICTALTTGTVIGFCSNVVVPRPPQFVPSFTWLTVRGTDVFDLDKAMAIARTVMARREVEMTPVMESLFRHVYQTMRQPSL